MSTSPSEANTTEFGDKPHQVIDTKPAGVTRIATVNVNGIRAAHRKGMSQWLADREIDILTLQEVRADESTLAKIVADFTADSGDEWSVRSLEAEAKGRAGVAVLSRVEPTATGENLPSQKSVDTGRWLETDHVLSDGTTLTVVSVYVHSGEVGTERQDHKIAFLDEMVTYLPQLAQRSDHVVVTGDLNVGHTERDIKNWKGNTKNSGFLPEERAYFDTFFGELGFVDVARSLAGDVDGPYTWWSYRGKAFDNDTGWRIDYQMATPGIAAVAQQSKVDRAQDYSLRWSDHAPLVLDYRI